MLQYAGHLIPRADAEACIDFLLSGQREDGVIPDRVQPDGTAIYIAGAAHDPLGQFNLDNGPFLMLAADKLLSNVSGQRHKALLKRWIGPLARGVDVIPRSANGLVYNEPSDPHSPYGFTDTIAKTGELGMCSLLYWRAAKHLARRFRESGDADQHRRWRGRAQRIEQQLPKRLWQAQPGALLAATEDCRQIDIWASAYALAIEFPLPAEQRQALRHFLRNNYDRYVSRGQVRHLLAGEYWDRLLLDIPEDRYQNGAYWATASGWVITALNQIDPALARRMLRELLADFKNHGVYECTHGDFRKLANYVVSATNPLGAVQSLRDE
jgi:hypothetical protein